MAKTESLCRSGAPKRLVNEFLDNGSKRNILRSAQGAIRPLASGISNYIRFCTLAASAAFPPSTGSVRRWVASFKPGETFGLYINLASKADILIGRDTAWITPEVRLLANGLRNAHEGRFAYPISL